MRVAVAKGLRPYLSFNYGRPRSSAEGVNSTEGIENFTEGDQYAEGISTAVDCGAAEGEYRRLELLQVILARQQQAVKPLRAKQESC